jgi:hypothetical protein
LRDLRHWSRAFIPIHPKSVRIKGVVRDVLRCPNEERIVRGERASGKWQQTKEGGGR